MTANKKGFTLIELLVVVLIIGILASIAIPQYFKVVEKARVSEAMSVISTIKSAEERFLAKGGVYTADFTQLDISYSYSGVPMTATVLPTKFFTGSLALVVAAGGGPGYRITMTRRTTPTVAPRYGAYAISATVPDSPAVVISACPGGAANCAELLD
ncbi:MAG: hypothetical protein A2X28_06960 [Elusimicrobia bacterium GWA2_56_46]|nr:MAG: hypothetical protein A2X28_06960 [Elusimicrobia bacterium GWA2_56_46]OGR54811.1 MAG: hypothetical protein A2X39_11030 [Elusimicrobia bacterium GWC2_56_31]HBW23398.1 hypothetical protein [Elusimicrobiota bacterium]